MSNTVTPTSGASYFGTGAATTTTKNKSQLNMENFMTLLTVQLQNQNPLQPMDDKDFFAQMAQLGQVQGTDQLIAASKIDQAQELMGKTVTAVRPMTDSDNGQNSLVSGVVKKLSIRNGEYYLGIQEADGGVVDVTMNSLQSVQPGQDITTAAALIGKTVAGTANKTANGTTSSVEVKGTVVGATNDGGRIMVQVEDSSGNVTPVSVNDIEHVLG